MKTTSLALGLASFHFAAAQLYPNQSPLNHTCALKEPVLSCSAGANPSETDTCCTETFGGLLLSTQFWTIYTGREAEGQLLPPKHWGLHGLWPDFCNGSYTQYCDLTRQYDPDPSPNTTTGTPSGTPVPPWHGVSIDVWIEEFGREDLIAWANEYWIAQAQPNTELWAHEFSKHATCFSTFDVPCYGPKYVDHEEIIDYFDTVIKYFMQVPTYEWLENASIVPSNSTSYSLSDFQGVLTDAYNETAAGKGSSDSGRTSLSEVWYFSHTLGRPQDHTGSNIAKVNSTTKSNCATTEGGVWYYERSSGSERS
ncbi:Ribonuclease T2-like protein [Cyphellophora attinorum]|uniref:ribonuclease T2 n=1 Tax=Cyphellophora attinorum TaxID=1664694 RepID=A0A0N1HUK0_9EURO|nr:Ribonuclease T2-like protein [Phialophora attinorum]KPI40645.1 Ribonuclease T2-like protein [Phialophora attinorum]